MQHRQSRQQRLLHARRAENHPSLPARCVLTWLKISTLWPVSRSLLISLSSSTILPLLTTSRSTALVCSSLSLRGVHRHGQSQRA